MNLGEALDAALRARYQFPDIKRPVTHRQGLTARMNALEKLFPGGRKGTAATKAAKAAGIAPRTWRGWRAGKSKPSARNARKLENAMVRMIMLPKFQQALKDQRLPNHVQVTGVIRWSNSPKKNYNKRPYRTTTLTSMRGVMRSTVRAWAMAGPEAAADAFQRGASAVYGVEPEDDGSPGIQIEGDQVQVEFQ